MDSSVSLETNPELLAVRLQRARLLQRKLALMNALGGMARYQPHPKQDLFHRAGGKFRRRMVRSGNRFGKSTMGCAEDCAWLRGERIWYSKDDPARREGIPEHPTKGLVITQDWDLVDSIFTSQQGGEGGRGGKIWRMLPRDGFVKSTKRNHSGVIASIGCANGSLLKFETVRSWQTNPKGVESDDWDFIHVDEPCPQLMYKAAARGLMDRRGSSWFTLTPLSEFWINDMFFPEDTGGRMRDDVWAVEGTTHDNPYLSREAIEDFMRELTEDEIQCRINGIPLHLSGLVYKQFSWAKHVLQELPKGWPHFSVPPDNWPVYMAIDPHPRTPHAVLFCTVDPFGKRYYFEDIFKHCIIRELCPEIHEVCKRRDGRGPRNVMWTKIDPLAYIDDPIEDTNMATEFEDNGVFVEKATKNLAGGILKVQEGLKEESMVFTPAATRTLWEIQRYAWDGEKDKPLDENDHMMENLYRLELSEPKWVDAKDRWIQPIGDIDDSSLAREEMRRLDDIAFAT